MGLYPKQKLKQAIIFQLKWLLWFQGRAIFLFTLSHFLPDLLFATSYLFSVRVPFTFWSRQHSRITTIYISLIRKLGAPRFEPGWEEQTLLLCYAHLHTNWRLLFLSAKKLADIIFFAHEVKVFQSNLKGPKIMGHFSWAQWDKEWRWQD